MILDLEDVNKSFGKTSILTDINLHISEPRLIALIAPNGSGKTTLLNIICNLEKVDSGTVSVADLPNDDVAIFEKVTYMQDNSILYPNLTGMDHLKLVQTVHQISNQKVASLLEKLRMENYIHRKVKYYSLGMKQHLLFSLSILPQPQLLLMDEPLNGLDPASVVRIRKILTQLYKKGTTILFSSHNLDQIDKLTSDIYFLKNKQLLSYKSILSSELKKTYQLITDNPFELSNKIKNSNIENQQLSDYKYQITCNDLELKSIQASKDFIIYDCTLVQTTLEKIYFDLYEDYTYDNTTI